jgi:hypothetical protein
MRDDPDRGVDEDESDRGPQDEPDGADAVGRGEMYEQSTSTGSTGQRGWQGGYDLPAPGARRVTVGRLARRRAATTGARSSARVRA